jgi:hypothetical protein
MIWGAKVDITALLSTLIVNTYLFIILLFYYVIGNLTLLILYGYSS